MRCTQIAGLSREAINWLNENQKEPECEECPHCGHRKITDAHDRVYGDAKLLGMFEDGPDLFEYDLKEGGVAREVVQTVPWSSGPVIFLCLEVDGKRIGEWSQKDIDNA